MVNIAKHCSPLLTGEVTPVGGSACRRRLRGEALEEYN